MPSIKNPGLRTSDGPISYADVLAAIPRNEATGDLLAATTNGGAIRKTIGDRGSLSTIQRHLEAIREEMATAALPVTAEGAPPAPTEIVAAIWSAAWSSAQAATLARLDRITAERDALAIRFAVQTADIGALTIDADQARDQATAAVAAAITARDLAQAQLQAREQDLNSHLDAERHAKAVLEAELQRVRADASHAAEMAAKDQTIERQALHAVIERLQEQVAQLRSLQIVAAGQAGQAAGEDEKP
jgi:hypothetical protein